jgi:carbamoyl-phosphate synthase small subunit
MQAEKIKGTLVLEDGSIFEGYAFGALKAVSGEVVFNTGMVGYPESLTDPSYQGQILVLTYPLIGNYGVPERETGNGFLPGFESDRIQAAGLIVAEYSHSYSHWSSTKTLSDWLKGHNVPALYGIDTRMLTKRLREKGTLPGKILFSDEALEFHDPNKENLVSRVSVRKPVVYPGGNLKIAVVDGGCKNSIIRSLLARGAAVTRVPWNYDFANDDFDGTVISNGPGDPKLCRETILNVKKALVKDHPLFGICLGHQILALAAGADTYKLKFGHRGQNQPCIEITTKRCYITSQNHGYAVVNDSLPEGWEPWFINANDGTNEGMRHRSRPFMSVQFHPEAMPGPVDTGFLFDEFLRIVRRTEAKDGFKFWTPAGVDILQKTPKS